MIPPEPCGRWETYSRKNRKKWLSLFAEEKQQYNGIMVLECTSNRVHEPRLAIPINKLRRGKYYDDHILNCLSLKDLLLVFVK